MTACCREPPSNYLPVHNYKLGIKAVSSTGAGRGDTVAPDTIGVCVKPLHFSYNKSLELLQFIELNRILGVSRYVAPSHYSNSYLNTQCPWIHLSHQ